MEIILFALVPLFVALLTNATKLIPVIDHMSDGPKKWTLRFLCAALSFGGAISVAASTGAPIDPTSIEIFSMAFVNFLGATGSYYLAKPKGSQVSGYNS